MPVAVGQFGLVLEGWARSCPEVAATGAVQPSSEGGEESGMIAINLLRDELGQDLVEYTLLMAFIALAGAAAILGMGADISTIWSGVNSRLAAANEGP